MKRETVEEFVTRGGKVQRVDAQPVPISIPTVHSGTGWQGGRVGPLPTGDVQAGAPPDSDA